MNPPLLSPAITTVTLVRFLTSIVGDDSDNNINNNDNMTSVDSSNSFTTLSNETFAPSDNSNDNHTATADDKEAYEFVAFLLWYLFLVVCCILPTCCAYRRRRLVEARITQQEGYFTSAVNANSHYHHSSGAAQNVFILSNLHLRPDLAMGLGGNLLKEERTRIITEELKATTFTVTGKDIADKGYTYEEEVEVVVKRQQPKQIGCECDCDCDSGDEKEMHIDLENGTNETSTKPSVDSQACKNTTSGKMEDSAACSCPSTATVAPPPPAPSSRTKECPPSQRDHCYCEDDEEWGNNGGDMTVLGDYELDSSNRDNIRLMLPTDMPNGNRTVSGTCAICLCPYQDGDEVTWSKEDSCQHAFHTECIIPWLAKKDEPKCPCCRQPFCPVALITSSASMSSARAAAAAAEFSIFPYGWLPATSFAAAAEGFMTAPSTFAFGNSNVTTSVNSAVAASRGDILPSSMTTFAETATTLSTTMMLTTTTTTTTTPSATFPHSNHLDIPPLGNPNTSLTSTSSSTTHDPTATSTSTTTTSTTSSSTTTTLYQEQEIQSHQDDTVVAATNMSIPASSSPPSTATTDETV